MPMIARLKALLDDLLNRRRREDELDEEIAGYARMQIEANRGRGMTEEEARRQARLAIGDAEAVKDAVRDVRLGRFVETLFQDIRFGLRTMVRRPAFALAALLTLALGIGINTALFSIVHTVLMKPLPYRNADRLAMIRVDLPEIGLGNAHVSLPEVADLRKGAGSLEGIEVINSFGLNLTGRGRPERVDVMQVSPGLASLLGVRPHLGRVVFTPEEAMPEAPYAAVLSHDLWRRRFGADPAAIGTIVYLDGNPTTIVGVLPEGFRVEIPPASHLLPSRFDLWLPVQAVYAEADRFSHNWAAVARLREGVSLAQAQDDLDNLASRLRETHYKSTGLAFRIVSLHETLATRARPALIILLGAAALIMVIVCVNVANLILVRTLSRQRELAIRMALGAGGGRIVRQLLTESIVIAILGGAVGLLLARWALPFLVALAPALPRSDQIELSVPVFIFCAVLCLLTGFLFGLIPALRSRKLTNALGAGSRGVAGGHLGKPARRLLVAGEVALSMMLVIAAGLMVRTFGSLNAVDPGFTTENALTFRLELQTDAYTQDEPVAFFRELEERIAALPGVTAVGSGLQLPLSGASWSGTDTFYETTNGAVGNVDAFEVDQRVVTPGYLDAMGIRLLEGRFFDHGDSAGSRPVAVVDRKLARRAWPGISPVGKRLALGQNPEQPTYFEVVGVVEHVRHHDLAADGRSQVYFTHGQRRFGILSVVVRAAADPMPLVPAIRGIVSSMDPRIPVFGIQRMDDYISAALAPTRFQLFLLGLFAWLGLILAAVGVTGVTSYMVSERRREIGIRITLGARPRSIFGIVVGEAMLIACIGIAVGMIGAAMATIPLRSLLFGVEIGRAHV